MTPQELKSSILQLAIQGKLVKQRPEEGTAEELYQQIQEEKRRLIKEGKLKKEKPLPKITEDEVTFDIPESWRWVRFRDLIYLVSGTSYDKKDVISQGLRILRGGNIVDDFLQYDGDDVFLPLSYADESKNVQVGDIVFVASTGSKSVIGKPAQVIDSMPNTQIGAFLRIARPVSSVISEYIWILFRTEYYREHIRKLATGTNINNVKAEHIENLVVPLPPLTEQKRIVAKIEELLTYIGRYKQAWSKLEDFNKRFPVDMQKSILQMAIQGKLVEQRPEEGTGEELYEQIQAEKQKLIKKEKIKKEKALPEIAEDEVPFDIPENWKWVKLGSLCQIQTGKRDANFGSKNGEYPFFTCAQYPIKCSSYSFDCEAILLAGNGDISNISYYCGKFEAYQRTYILSKICSNVIDFTYLYWHIKSNWVRYNLDKMFGTAIPYIRLGNLQQYPVALPPLAEQKRIVAKIEKLLPLCDRLK